MSLLQELVRQHIVEQGEVAKIQQLAEETGEGIEAVLLKRGISEKTLMKVKGEYLNMPVRVLGGNPVSYNILRYIPEDSARHYEFVPIGIQDGVLEIGITDPDNIEAMDALQFISTRIKMPFRVYLVSERDFKNTISGYSGITGEMSTVLSELDEDYKPLQISGNNGETDSRPEETEGLEKNNRENETEDSEDSKNENKKDESLDEEGSKHDSIQQDLQKELKNAAKVSSISRRGKSGSSSHIVEDAPVSKMVAVILRHAVEGKASDIHIEHTGEKIRVRFRIDGELHTSLLLPKNIHAAMVSRIKILTNLKLDEKRKPQDGRFSAKIDDRRIDFRVSTYPAYFGEKVVMRILDSEKGIQSISDLGLRKEDYDKIKKVIQRPYGLILLTGPTGSGKSTSLYSMLSELDRDKANIVSLEDPIEYHIDGVNQSNVRPEIGYTFATGLRSILRQDPDIIMVGEIRDKETAQLAIQAALTGHLVFSTLHTNTATGVVPRLIDMGVDPYLIAPTLLMAIGQRLAVKLCEGAGKKVPIDESMRAMIDKQLSDLSDERRKEIAIPEHVYEAVPTSACPAGVRGRQAVFEILEVNNEIRHTILTNPVETEVFQVARKNGMLTMKEDALLKAFEGVIPYVEVNKL